MALRLARILRRVALSWPTQNWPSMEAPLADNPQNTGRRKLVEHHQPGQNFVLYANENADEIYVDGIGAMTGGSAVTRLDFFTTTGTEAEEGPFGNREIREIRVRIVMPTATLLEGLFSLIEQLRGALPTMRAGHEQYVKHVDAQFDKIEKSSG